MQHDKDENAAPQSHELPELTAAEHLFVVGVTKGGLSQAAAYRAAYPESENWKPQSVWTEASKLRRRPHVAMWVSAIRADMAREANVSREYLVDRTLEIAERAMNEGKYIAAINGLQLIGKLEGYLGNEQRESPHKGKSDGLLDQINKSFGPEAAKQAAKRLGLESETVH